MTNTHYIEVLRVSTSV